ncbi:MULTISPECIES: CHAT domain-containing protein [unclassified Microcoleus]|uniref:CHAT domain-containing protein n=1 Tax=unclassified Microcoleus TaxID=2642155 RepID=UPI002FCEACB0
MIITRITQGYQQLLLTYTWVISLGLLLFSPAATGQPITPSPDGTGTAVNASGNQFNINGGQLSKDGTNLFHSFQQFGLKDGQIVNFISDPNIRNILGRVVGGDASYINGLIQVIGGNSNLFLMNPAGIVFGSNAQLNVPGSFLATTATGIGFGNNWFQAVGVNEYAMLIGTPSTLNFGTAQPGAIANFGQLRVPNGQTLALIGGTVFSPGTLSAPSGQIAIASVPGENLVRISQAGHLLSLEISPSSNLDSASVPLSPLTLSQLLTGGSSNATGVTVNSDGSVQLTNSDLQVEAGDVAIADTQATGANQNLAVSAQTATVSAARNLTLVNRQLQTAGDLKLQAGENVRIRDSAANYFVAGAGGNLTVQGDREINIQARNHSQSLLSAGGRITLTSNGTVSGDALFRAGSDFSIATLQGSPGNLASSGGSTIVSGGNVSFGNYAGASLGVQAEGAIAAGDLAISSASSDRPQLVLTAGNLPTPLTGKSTLAPASSSPASIQVGNIAIAGSVFLGAANSIQAASITSNGGELALVASGDITAENLNTSTLTGNAGNITLYSTEGSINTNASTLNASSIAGNGGSIFLYGTNAIVTGEITTSSFIGNGGSVTLYSEGKISTGNINTSGIKAGEISFLSNPPNPSVEVAPALPPEPPAVIPSPVPAPSPVPLPPEPPRLIPPPLPATQPSLPPEPPPLIPPPLPLEPAPLPPEPRVFIPSPLPPEPRVFIPSPLPPESPAPSGIQFPQLAPLNNGLVSLTPSAIQCLTEEQLLEQQAGVPLQTAPKDYSKAIACYQQNLELARLSRDRAREGYALNNLGATYYAIGDYEKAISYHQQRLAQAESRADLLGKGQAFIGLGAAYGAIGNYKKAIEYYEQSLEVAYSLKSADLEASVLRNLGLVYYAQKEYHKAVEYQEQSLAIAKQQRDRRGEALALSNLGLVHYSLTNYAQAIDEQKQSLAMALELRDRFVQGRALENLGIAYYAVKNYSQAIESYQKSLAIARELSDRHAEGRALSNLGDAFYKAKQPAEAIKAFFLAIEIWESLRSNLNNNDLNLISIFETQETSYSTLQEVLANQNQHKEALEIAERGRAQAFVRLLTHRFSAQSAHATLKSSETQIKPIDIPEIQQIAKEHNSTLVSYSLIKEVIEADGQRKLQDSELYIWVTQPTGKIEFRRISLKRLAEEKTSLKALITQGRCFIPSCLRNKQRSQPATNPTPTKPLVDQRFLDPSLQELYQLLIEPIADLLPQDPASRITFIPHESLFLVPFAALQDTSGNYLIERHTILTAPSIQVLSLTKKQQQLASGKGALVVGNPTMPSVAFTTNQPPQQLSSLPHAEAEAIAIAQLLNAEPLTGDKATKVAVLQQIERSRIVHLATHGILDDVEGLGVPGVIALAPSKDDSGLLTASEIFNLRLNAELVVLSACNTGRGRITGDGIIGLSRSFIAAGVPSVVVSLWSVTDESTAELMAEFYRQMQLTPDIAQALRKAMLVTLVKHPNPVDWAAFTLIGEAEKR